MFLVNPYTFAAANHPIVQDWLDRLVGDQPSQTVIDRLNTFFFGCDEDGNDMAIGADLFHIVAGMETDEQRTTPLITSSGNNFTVYKNGTGSTYFNADGMAGDGVGMYMDLEWNPTLHRSVTTNNNSFFGVFVTTKSMGVFPEIGTYDTGSDNWNFIYPWFGPDIIYASVNRTAGFGQIGQFDSRGFIVGARLNNNDSQIWRNGVMINSTNTGGLAPETNQNVLFGCANVDGTPGQFSARNKTALIIGKSTAINQELLYDRLRTLMIDIGIAPTYNLIDQIFGQDGEIDPGVQYNLPSGWSESGEAGQFAVYAADQFLDECLLAGSSGGPQLIFSHNTTNESILTTNSISTVGYSNLKLSFNRQYTNISFTNFTIEYSLNGSTWSSLTTPQTLIQFTWLGTGSISLPQALENQATVYFRISMTGDGSTQPDGIDDFKVTAR